MLFLCAIVCLIKPQPIFANPYFYLTGPTSVETGEPATYTVKVDTDGDQITAAQAVVQLPPGYFTASSVSVSGSNCSLWTPANSAPPGSNTTTTTPYFNSNLVVFTCGFAASGGSGFSSATGTIGKFTVIPSSSGSVSMTFPTTAGYNVFYFIGSSIATGAMSSYNITITGGSSPTPTPTPTGTLSPSPTPTPTPTGTQTPTPTPTLTPTITPTPSITPTPTTASSSSSSTEYALTADDINFVELQELPSADSGRDETDITEAEIIEEDNTVPPPGEITPRPPATPFPTPGPQSEVQQLAEGEVRAVQSIRELLIPGESEADRTVVLFNLLSLLTLLAVIAIIVWRMFTIRRTNKIKQTHIAELVSGELAALESKLNVLDDKSGDSAQFKAEFSETIQTLLEEMNDKNKGKKKE